MPVRTRSDLIALIIHYDSEYKELKKAYDIVKNIESGSHSIDYLNIMRAMLNRLGELGQFKHDAQMKLFHYYGEIIRL